MHSFNTWYWLTKWSRWFAINSLTPFTIPISYVWIGHGNNKHGVNNKQEQRIKCSIGLDEVAKQCSTRKIFLEFFNCTRTMINILIIFLTQYFQRTKTIQWLEDPFSTKGFKVQSFFIYFFYEQNGWKKTFNNFI